MKIIFLDTETTGLDTRIHRPIDIAFKILDANTHEVNDTFQSLVQWPKEIWDDRDLTSIEINGYTWEDICRGREVEQIREEIIQKFHDLSILRGEAVFICQNPSFDRSFFNHLVPVYTQEKLNWPYHWLDFASMYWTKLVQNTLTHQQKLPEKMSLSKDSIALAVGLPRESNPHRAINGVEHLIQCYLTVLYNLNSTHV